MCEREGGGGGKGGERERGGGVREGGKRRERGKGREEGRGSEEDERSYKNLGQGGQGGTWSNLYCHWMIDGGSKHSYLPLFLGREKLMWYLS